MRHPNQSAAPELVVMLTCNDYTIDNAEEVFEQCRNTRARWWGMKEQPLGERRMKALFSRMKECGKATVLEVVGYDETAALNGARLALACGCDILMGTKFFSTVADLCNKNSIRYMPFVGNIIGRPSVLHGSIDEIVEEARYAVANGASGIDLLGYRYTGNTMALNKAVAESIQTPLCIAGSIDCYQRLDEVKASGADMFTIGSAFFNNKFNGTIAEQIDKVCEYLSPASGR